MRIPTILFSLLLLMASSLSAQKEPDSLRQAIDESPNDTNKVWLLRDLYKAHYNRSEIEKMIEVSDEGLVLSRQLQYPKGIDYMIYYKATALDLAGRGTDAIPLYEEGLALARTTGNEDSQADYHLNLGVAYYYRGDKENALSHYLSAHDIFEKLGEKEKLAKVLNNIAVIYRLQDRFERAEEIYRQSFELKKELGDTLGMAASLQNLGVVLSLRGEVKPAIEGLKNAIVLYSAKGDLAGKASSYTTLGKIYLDNNMLDDGKSAYQEAWNYFELHPDVSFTALTLHGLGKWALMTDRFGQAEGYLRKSLLVTRQNNQDDIRLSVLKDLVEALKNQGKYKASFKTLEEAYALRDSLTEEKRLTAMEEMQAKFDVQQKGNELKISQMELAQRTTERNWFRSGAVLLALLVFAVFFAFRYRLRLNRRTAAHRSEIQEQRILHLEQQNKVTALTAMLKGQEQERNRVANDLHDSLGGLITSIKSHLNASKQDGKLFEKTNALLDRAAAEVRRISHNMMPRSLTLSGLKGALEDLAQDLEQQGIHCEIELIGLENLQLSPTSTVMVYRIVQELTHNVLKHAAATNLLLQAMQNDGRLTLILEDNGKGFHVQEAFKKKGLGLTSIQSRVKFLQGEIEWDSVEGQGTTVSVIVPLNV